MNGRFERCTGNLWRRSYIADFVVSMSSAVENPSDCSSRLSEVGLLINVPCLWW